MLYHLLYPLSSKLAVLNLFRYITFRAAYAALTALLISLLLGPTVIRRLRAIQVGQQVRKDGPQTHLSKAGTPTMGGLLILLATVVPTLMWADLSNLAIWLALASLVGCGAIGVLDDLAKVRGKSSAGLAARGKLVLQWTLALGVGAVLTWLPPAEGMSALQVPVLKHVHLELGVLYVLFAGLVIVGSSNAVNLTDGLDGLAIGPVTIAAGTFAVLSYVAGHSVAAGYLGIDYLRHAGELSVFCAALFGAGLGFLWFNAFPAQVFMGDSGSLALGGALGCVALLVKQELLLVVIGGVFVAEALSVLVQVGSFKLFGRRVFDMAPLHHHFEMRGLSEPKIIVRFWIVSILLAVFALSTLKIR
ncbi:MAG: phospho-N-acetylmuramoyl-pentapeptide-transferase [Candidatus Schekmanbacteria bacterium]|nr:phospho-N-acetylmuramoyl-pentapeptide-transferase [Candidatus Schekmanbacteria bacterium]